MKTKSFTFLALPEIPFPPVRTLSNHKISIYILFALIKCLCHSVPPLCSNFSGLKEFNLNYLISVAFFVLASAYVLRVLCRFNEKFEKSVEIFGSLISLSSPPSCGNAGAYTEKVMTLREKKRWDPAAGNCVTVDKKISVWLGKERCWQEICGEAQDSE